ncbi:MAG: hypothetical protein WC647_01860 [Desulfomonilaceae bacterium]|jgi:hypothetical protein
MEKNEQGVRAAVTELADNLGVIGVFMLGEARAFLVKSWGASREEFFVAVDQISKTMKQSGNMAVDDIDRAADKIKQSWDLLIQEKCLDWDAFFSELKNRLAALGNVSKDTFDLCVDQAAETLDKQWTAFGRVGENQVKYTQEQIGYMASSVKSQWDVIWDTMQQTGDKIDRAVDAAWEEFKK